jgi:hypothetical protein
MSGWLVRAKGRREEWLIDVRGKNVTVMQCQGAFALPVAAIEIGADVAAQVAKAIVAAGKQAKPKRAADMTAGGQS